MERAHEQAFTVYYLQGLIQINLLFYFVQLNSLAKWPILGRTDCGI